MISNHIYRQRQLFFGWLYKCSLTPLEKGIGERHIVPLQDPGIDSDLIYTFINQRISFKSSCYNDYKPLEINAKS